MAGLCINIIYSVEGRGKRNTGIEDDVDDKLEMITQNNQCSTSDCSIVQYSVGHCCTVQRSIAHYSIAQCSAHLSMILIADSIVSIG
jgi:hypothetical protein